MTSLDAISIGDDVGESACMGTPYVAVCRKVIVLYERKRFRVFTGSVCFAN